MGLHHKSGLTYALAYASKELNGIGTSKVEARANSNSNVSPKIHSYATFDRYMGVAKEFVNFAKDQGVNKLHKLDSETVEKFLQEKIEKGFTQKTLKVNLCALEKFLTVIEKSNLAENLRENFTETYSQATPSGRAEKFDNPQRMIDTIRTPEHKVVAELQHLTGARIGDVPKIDVQAEKVSIEGSKGGRDRVLDYSDRGAQLERIGELRSELDKHIQEKGWQEIRESYYKEIKYACKANSEIYTGSHAFRVSYATERFEQLSSQGLTRSESLQTLTQELGHGREEMAAYYVR